MNGGPRVRTRVRVAAIACRLIPERQHLPVILAAERASRNSR